MPKVRKLKYVIAFLLSGCMLVLPLWANAEVMNVTGEMSSHVTAYLTRRFTGTQDTKNLVYRIYLPYSVEEGINTQIITDLKKIFTPFPTEINPISDEYGNSGLELIWNRKVQLIQVNLQFSAKTHSSFYPISSKTEFPLDIEGPQKIFLTSTELSPSNNMLINYIGRTISLNLSREIDVVKSVFIWLDRNIRVSSKHNCENNNDALSVLKNRKGTSKGICNLAAAIFKGLGIPARVVFGISFQKEFELQDSGKKYIYNLPNNTRFWLEVYFPDVGWVGYDPRGMYFGATSHTIKFSVGPDSSICSDHWMVERGEATEYKDFIYDIKEDSVNLVCKSTEFEHINKLAISPVVPEFTLYINEPELEKKGLELNSPKPEPPEPTEKREIVIQVSNTTSKLSIVATQNRVFTQQFRIDAPLSVEKIVLPLIKFDGEGRIWVEFYSDNGGVPGASLFRTYSVDSDQVGFMMIDEPWLTFQVMEKNSYVLKPGVYWFSLHSVGNSIFNWNATEGNVFGGPFDTRFKDINLKQPQWNNILNFDLNFRILGTSSDTEKNPSAQTNSI